MWNCDFPFYAIFFRWCFRSFFWGGGAYIRFSKIWEPCWDVPSRQTGSLILWLYGSRDRSIAASEQRQHFHQLDDNNNNTTNMHTLHSSALLYIVQSEPATLKLSIFLVAEMRNDVTDLQTLWTTCQWKKICAFCLSSGISSTPIYSSHHCRWAFIWAFVAKALVWISYRCLLPSLISWHHYISL